jgi:hypothetical protein
MASVGSVHQRGLAGLVGGSVVGAGFQQGFDICGIARLGGGE